MSQYYHRRVRIRKGGFMGVIDRDSCRRHWNEIRKDNPPEPYSCHSKSSVHHFLATPALSVFHATLPPLPLLTSFQCEHPRFGRLSHEQACAIKLGSMEHHDTTMQSPFAMSPEDTQALDVSPAFRVLRSYLATDAGYVLSRLITARGVYRKTTIPFHFDNMR